MAVSKNSALYSVFTISIFVCSEGLFQSYYYLTSGRFLYERNLLRIYQDDPILCFALKPSLNLSRSTNEFSIEIYTNTQGFRTDSAQKAVAYSKADGRYRVVFLSPSMTFGGGTNYEQTFPALIGEKLKARGINAEIVNVETPAQPPSQQLCWLKEEGYRYHPDLIVQTVYQSPDVISGECVQPLVCPRIVDGEFRIQLPPARAKILALAKNSGLVFYGWYPYQSIVQTKKDARSGQGLELYSEIGSALPTSIDVDGIVQKFVHFETNVARYLGAKTPIIFIYTPLSYVVHGEDRSRWQHIEPSTPERLYRVTAEVEERLTARGTTFINPVQTLVKRALEERMHSWLDIHLTEAGSEVIADELIGPISEKLAPVETHRGLAD